MEISDCCFWALQVSVIKADGGQNRNCAFAGVQLAYLCFTFELNLNLNWTSSSCCAPRQGNHM
jgi:hypothetical protein